MDGFGGSKMYGEMASSLYGRSLREIRVEWWLVKLASKLSRAAKLLSAGQVVAAILILLVAFPPASLAQGSQSTGAIQGSVQDSTGAVLPGATVTLTNPSLGL